MTIEPSRVSPPADKHLPPVYLTLHDCSRLRALLAAERARVAPQVRSVLLREIDRATLCPSPAILADVVTMHSRVVFRRHPGQPQETRTLCYDDEDALVGGTLSILTPLGTALIGLRSGATMPYEALDGRHLLAMVDAVPYQPQAHGRSVSQLRRLWPARPAGTGRLDDDPGPSAA
jgi:regulator of nucleoside diphosphate kinase